MCNLLKISLIFVTVIFLNACNSGCAKECETTCDTTKTDSVACVMTSLADSSVCDSVKVSDVAVEADSAQ